MKRLIYLPAKNNVHAALVGVSDGNRGWWAQNTSDVEQIKSSIKSGKILFGWPIDPNMGQAISRLEGILLQPPNLNICLKWVDAE